MQFKPTDAILLAFVAAVLLVGAGLLATGWFSSVHIKIPFLIAILFIAVAVAVVLPFTQP